MLFFKKRKKTRSGVPYMYPSKFSSLHFLQNVELFFNIFFFCGKKIVSKKAGRLVLKKDMKVHLKDLFLLPMDLFCKSYSLMEAWICVSLPVNKVKCYIKSIREFLPGKITRGLWFWIVMNCILLRNRQILCIC